jgi:very-short-patch-repair endonuclease
MAMNKQEWLFRKSMVETARELRKNMTVAEKIMWVALRDRRFRRIKFRRQVPIDRFIVDFLCMPPKLVIEIDGDIHDTEKEYDVERETVLREKHYRFLRIRNEEVFADLDAVLEKIRKEIYDAK